jgi:hypothetical protein
MDGHDRDTEIQRYKEKERTIKIPSKLLGRSTSK